MTTVGPETAPTTRLIRPSAEGLEVVSSSVLSDRGRCRSGNEDRSLVTPPLFAVADGVGGGLAGEVAAQLALDALARADTVGIDPAVLLRAGFATAGADIRRAGAVDPSRAGMSTTLAAALVTPKGVTLANVGDSRVYLHRAGHLHQLTHDHSLVGELVRRGELAPHKAASHPLRSVITRCLGGPSGELPDVYSIRPRTGDVYLLCSDGLSDQVAEERVVQILGQSRDLGSAAHDLVAAANAAGGRDNVTVVLFRLGHCPSDAGPSRRPHLRTLPSGS